MANYWVVVDVSNMAHRAWAVLGSLKHEGAATGVVYGIALQLAALVEAYGTKNLVCCFDGGCTYRTNIYPQYKANRRERYEKETEEEKRGRAALRDQLVALRKVHLPGVGVQNILWRDGYEGDDFIAAAVEALPLDDGAVILSSDEDLWQCLRPGVSCLAPTSNKRTGYQDFVRTWGMLPLQWAEVKAWAGCAGDNVAGLPRVGAKTAAKFVRGEIQGDHPKYELFVKHLEVYTRNMQLVQLPAKGLGPVVITPQQQPLQWSVLHKAIGSQYGETKKRGFGF